MSATSATIGALAVVYTLRAKRASAVAAKVFMGARTGYSLRLVKKARPQLYFPRLGRILA